MRITLSRGGGSAEEAARPAREAAKSRRVSMGRGVAEASGSRTHPRHKVPHDGFEARAQHRPRIASSPILAGRRPKPALRRCARRGYTGDRAFPDLPRSSNGRTAAFGAVNRGSNPCRGANTFLPQLQVAILLTAALATRLTRIRNIPQVFVRRAFSPVGREASCGSKLNPQG
jgi:hypothetical protein